MTFDFNAARRQQQSQEVPRGRTTIADLLAMRAAIDAQLPARALSEINVDEELVTQLLVAKELQSQVLDDPDVPSNQRAQVVNAVGSIIDQLTKAQERYYNAERFKRIEAILIKALAKLPTDVAEDFIDHYEKLIKAEK